MMTRKAVKLVNSPDRIKKYENDKNVFILEEKFRNLMNLIYAHSVNFPTYERHGILSDIRERYVRGISLMTLARKVKSKRLIYSIELEETFIEFQELVKLSKTHRYIPIKFYASIEPLISEINKMITGLIKSSISP